MRTLLLLAREPKPGRVKTRLASAVGDEAACDLYRAFLLDLAQLVRASPWRVEWWVDGDLDAVRALVGAGDEFRAQPEGDLGERLAGAFADAFRRGASPAAAAGTDCPLLTRSHLAGLFEAVEAGADAAILPAEDGGYAALALARPEPRAFVGIPWSTEGVLPGTLRALGRANCRTTLLDAVFDVDREEDLRRLETLLSAAPELAPHTAAALRPARRLRCGDPP